MSNIFFTADTHFGHRIFEFCPKTRGGAKTTEEMNELLIEKWNETIKDSDEVYILGDFCWKPDADKYINRLNGRLKFITGNHDIWMKKFYLKRMNTKKNIELLGNYKEIRHNKNKVVLCHYPIVQWNRMQYGSWHLYGHMHGALEIQGKALDVGIDNRKNGDMKPFSIDEIEEYMKTRPVSQHHLIVKHEEEVKHEKEGA